jgi:serine/threonine protein kinase
VNPEDDEKPALSAGEVLPDEVDGTKFQVADLIARGGMGEVYRASRLSDGARCAIKCVRRDLAQSATVLLRTRFEARAFRIIRHPNVVCVLGTGVRRDKLPWMCMEWLDGFTLAEILELRSKIPLPFAIRIVRDLCKGLMAIHPHAIHRDIKPSNVHLGFDCVTGALDLGAAKPKEANIHLTTTGFQVGTLPFMAPEQLDNTLPIDHRADLWAAIIVLYVLMTGVHPFAINGALPASKMKLGWGILTLPHLPLLSALPSAPPFLGEIIDRGLAKDPADRHGSAEELVFVLTAALAQLEALTKHAEPLSTLVNDLRGTAEPIVAEPPRLWVPRTTEPMPEHQPKSQPTPHRALVSVPWASPRMTEPMPAAIPQAALEPATLASTAPGGPHAAPDAPTRGDEVWTPGTGEREERIEIVPEPPPPAVVEGSNAAAPGLAASPARTDEVADREDHAAPLRTSDVRLKPFSPGPTPCAPSEPTPAKPPEPSPLATLGRPGTRSPLRGGEPEETAPSGAPASRRWTAGGTPAPEPPPPAPPRSGEGRGAEESARSAGVSSARSADASPARSADVSPTRNADVSPARGAGVPRWLVVFAITSAVGLTAELAYLVGPWRGVEPKPAAIVVPADSSGEPSPAETASASPGPAPPDAPAPSATPTGAPAASATAARATAAPSTTSRPRPVPHTPVLPRSGVLATPRVSPTATSPRELLFRSQQ